MEGRAEGGLLAFVARGGLARVEAGVACFAAAKCCAAAAARAREEEGRGGSYIQLCRAKIGGAAEPCPVSGQRSWSPPHQPSAAPPCMARHRHLAAPGQ